MKTKYLATVLILLLGAGASSPSSAGTTFAAEDFTGGGNINSWYFVAGACLTAGTSSSSLSPGVIPSCNSILASYYNTAANADPYLLGGALGYLGSATAPGSLASQIEDPIGQGALRFTNGSINIAGSWKYGHNERGAILSANTFPTNAGIQVTFKTITYHGDGGGAGADGADGISFFLQDGSQTPGLGAFGGSLAYSCSNANPPYDGLYGGYIGLGIDEYGNFLNGTYLMPGYSGTNTATGDNSAYGYGYKPGRIGLRGAGSVSWAALSNYYGTDPGNSAMPYYPPALATSCVNAGGTYSAATNNCINICNAAGSYLDTTTGLCNNACPVNYFYDPTTNACNSCTSVNGTYDAPSQMCINTTACVAGTTYYAGTNTCDSCPTAGYTHGTYSGATGMCTASCPAGTTYSGTGGGVCYPTGVQNSGNPLYYCPSGDTIVGTTCYPTGSVYAAGYYCPTGDTISTTYCFPAGLSYATGFYCPAGQTINVNVCYPNGDLHAGNFYCPAGQTITGTSCYPTGDSNSGTNYCPSGQTISGGTNCYPTGDSILGTNYCPSGQTITGTSCYPNGDLFSGTNNCPSGQTINGTSCYPNGDVYAAGYYCTAGNVVNGTFCSPTGDSYAAGHYCLAGKTIDGTGAFCYPNGDVYAAGHYCTAGNVVNGAFCSPTGDSYAAGHYCLAGKTIDATGAWCYPNGDAYATGHYCAATKVINAAGTECCPAATTYVGPLCSDSSVPVVATAATASTVAPGATAATASTVAPGATAATVATVAPSATAATVAIAMTAATAMPLATVMPAATAMSAATAAPAATAVFAATLAPATTSVTPNQTATLITSPTVRAVGTYTPGTGRTDALYAVQKTCKTGELYNYETANAPTDAGPAVVNTVNPANTFNVLDYAPIPNAYKEITSFSIAAEGASTRSQATPIFYTVKITKDGLLSLAYSVSGGAYSYLIQNQSILAANGPLPASFRVGFAASDGGASNVHEIMCFKATTDRASGSSASVNEKEVAKVDGTAQAYFAFYDPNNWTGTVTANTLTNNNGVVSVSPIANWDASCVLTGTLTGVPAAGGGCATTGAAGPTSPTPAPTSRVMLTWDTVNNIGIPFEWASLNGAQQAALDFGDATPTALRLNYLRGDRSNEINSMGVGLYRDRDAVLGDIVDSSPAWVGPPSSPYTQVWQDRLYPGTPMPENSGTQSYLQFVSAEQTRLNVVYVGANDGFLHGFRTGSFDVNGNFVANATTPNDGQEVLAYMPGTVLASAAMPAAVGGCTSNANTQSVVQNIHGVTPAIGANAECTEGTLDLTNSQYGHNFFVDATPATGDLFFGGQWHTWLVGGLGAGGEAIYALDITNPSNFSETTPTGVVIGEWNPATISCSNSSGGANGGANCGNNLGNTFGTPAIRRLHDGNWAVIFGNGFGSQTGDAGIYVMTIDINAGTQTFYYLSTNTGGVGVNNGIAYVTPVDLDGDHVTDYVYAGDLLGNVWRFDLTSPTESNWATPAAPFFTTQTGQPITTQLLAISTTATGSSPRLMIEFGTGQRTQLTNLGPVQYANAPQSIYGVWDWNMKTWNGLTPTAPYLSLAPGATGLGSPYTLGAASLQPQTLTVSLANSSVVDGTNLPVCWQGTAACGANGSFGWYANLPNNTPATANAPASYEQIIYNPQYTQGAFTVNSTVPAVNVATTCSSNIDEGFTYALSVANGGVFTNTFPTFSVQGTLVSDAIEAGVMTNATGSVYVVKTGQGTLNFVYQTISGTPGTQEANIPSNTKAKRLTWIERR